jgi:uncharacterized membrane-anchored protein
VKFQRTEREVGLLTDGNHCSRPFVHRYRVAIVTNVSRVLLFWVAFILTRPLGATLGDFLDKPLEHGGLALSRPIASAVIAAIMIACILVLPQRAGRHPGQAALVS